MQIEIKTLDNGSAGTAELPDEIFATKPRTDIMARVVHWQQAKARAPKTRTGSSSSTKSTAIRSSGVTAALGVNSCGRAGDS